MTALRSLLFNILMFSWTGLLCVLLLWALLLPKAGFLAVIRWYLRTLTFLEKTVLGLDYRVEGLENLPEGPVLIAAKHQSMWETMKLHLILDDPAVILKRELLKIPLWGWYARKADLIAVDRGGKGRAVASLIEGSRRIIAQNRPIVIFPQGTRVTPGQDHPYRSGIFALYETLDLPVVPMALNSGVFWGRRAFRKHSGTITVQFLEAIPPGLGRDGLAERLRPALEEASDRLASEAEADIRHRERPALTP